jgi:hypothetical protein
MPRGGIKSNCLTGLILTSVSIPDGMLQNDLTYKHKQQKRSIREFPVRSGGSRF